MQNVRFLFRYLTVNAHTIHWANKTMYFLIGFRFKLSCNCRRDEKRNNTVGKHWCSIWYGTVHENRTKNTVKIDCYTLNWVNWLWRENVDTMLSLMTCNTDVVKQYICLWIAKWFHVVGHLYWKILMYIMQEENSYGFPHNHADARSDFRAGSFKR